MKKLWIIAVLAIAVVACNMDGYAEYSLTSRSDFEFDKANYTDSLFLTDLFYGGSTSYLLIFNSSRDTNGKDMTGGFGLTMKRDSSLVIAESNAYPKYTMYTTTATLNNMNSTGCAVFYQNDDSSAMPDHDIWFYSAEDGTCTPAYCQINNTQLTVYNVLSDESSLKFKSGDFLKLTITGILDGKETGSIEYYLADYRGDGSKPDSVLTSWKTLSLSKLGNIEYIDFSLECNKEGFPKTFCFDNLVSSIYVKY